MVYIIKVFTTGTFDVLHYGHINLLKNAKQYGDYLIVGLNVNPENKAPFYSAENRKIILESIKYVDEVVMLYSQDDKYKYIENCDYFVIGDDYKNCYDIDRIKSLCNNIVFIQRTPNISSTQIRNSLDKIKYKTLVIDIDNTICFVKNRDFINAEPNTPVINKINYYFDLGYKIILFTSRGRNNCGNNISKIESKYKKITEDWLNKNNVKYNDLLFGKPNADVYIDDKSMHINEFLESSEI